MAAKKHPGGRPRIYSNCLDLAAMCEIYMESCWQEVTKSQGKGENRIEWQELVQTEPYTMSGLANALGMTRVSLLNYSNRDEFFSTIKKYRSLCEEYAEKQLYRGKNATGPIFGLINNFEEWRNTSSHEHTGKDGGPIEVKKIKELSREELIEIASNGTPQQK